MGSKLKFNKQGRREVSEPPKLISLSSMKMFNEADFLVLENRSTSQARSFKVFDEKQVFPNKKTAPGRLQPPQAEEKHDECDYETEEEHVLKAHELMLEDLHESI